MTVVDTYRVLQPVKTGGRRYDRGELIPAAADWAMPVREQRLRARVLEKCTVDAEEYQRALAAISGATPDEETAERPAPETETPQTVEPVEETPAAEAGSTTPEIDTLVEEEIPDEGIEDVEDEADDTMSVEDIEEEDSIEEEFEDEDAPVNPGTLRRKIVRKNRV